MLKKRKKDLIFIFSILIFAVFLLLIQRVYGNAQDEADLVKITVNQKLYGTYDLNKNQTITIQNNFGIKSGIAHQHNPKQYQIFAYR